MNLQKLSAQIENRLFSASMTRWLYILNGIYAFFFSVFTFGVVTVIAFLPFVSWDGIHNNSTILLISVIVAIIAKVTILDKIIRKFPRTYSILCFVISVLTIATAFYDDGGYSHVLFVSVLLAIFHYLLYAGWTDYEKYVLGNQLGKY